jgi:HNH endonuclease
MEPGDVTKRLKKDGYLARQSQRSQSLFLNLGGSGSEINRNDFKGLIVINEGTIFGTQQISDILEFRNLLMQEKEGKWVPRENVRPSPQGKDGCVSVKISQDEPFIFSKIGEDFIRLYGKKQQIDFNEKQYNWADIEGFIETISDVRIGSQHDGPLRAEKADLTLPNELGESKASDDFAQNVEACTLELKKNGKFDPTGIEDARARVVRAVATRRGQPAFRNSLLRAYGGRCCISGCAVQEVLEAAHIVPYQGDATDHFQNGLLLRSDLHTLFDWHLLTIESENHTVLLDGSLRDSEYWKFAGQQIRLPEITEQHPSPKALAQHAGSGT